LTGYPVLQRQSTAAWLPLLLWSAAPGGRTMLSIAALAFRLRRGSRRHPDAHHDVYLAGFYFITCVARRSLAHTIVRFAAAIGLALLLSACRCHRSNTRVVPALIALHRCWCWLSASDVQLVDGVSQFSSLYVGILPLFWRRWRWGYGCGGATVRLGTFLVHRCAGRPVDFVVAIWQCSMACTGDAGYRCSAIKSGTL
jgi:hypothetical protein